MFPVIPDEAVDERVLKWETIPMRRLATDPTSRIGIKIVDGEAALAFSAAKEDSYDLILTDVRNNLFHHTHREK